MKAVILAAGRGTRMQREVAGTSLDDAQRRTAELGLKALIPIHGRPFLDHVISAVADAGLGDVCLVVGPGDHPVRAHYAQLKTERVRLSFAVQAEPRGGAHALLAAESFAQNDPVIVLNSDNYYPASALRALNRAAGSALAGFQRDALINAGNATRERLAAYAIVRADASHNLRDIMEKPGAAELARSEGDANSWISMTCWRFQPPIFTACRAIAPSTRGEYEIPDAVMYAQRVLGEQFRVIPVNDAVLDLTSREDIAHVERILAGHDVRL